MKSYATLITDFQNMTRNTDTANQTLAGVLLNDSYRKVLTMQDWPFLERTGTITSVANQRNYQLPNRAGTVVSVTLTVGTIVYRPTPIEDMRYWEYLLSLNTGASNSPMHYTLIRNATGGMEVHFYPALAAASNTITTRFLAQWKDLTVTTDYSTGTVDAVTNASAAVSGSGTTWSTAFPGRFLRITTDGYWYEIASRTSDTAITLAKVFEGTTVASPGALAYVIGEMPMFPGEYHDILLWRSLALYYMQNNDMSLADRYWNMYDGGHEAGRTPRIGGLLAQMIRRHGQKVEGVSVRPRLSDRIVDRNFPAQTVEGESWA